MHPLFSKLLSFAYPLFWIKLKANWAISISCIGWLGQIQQSLASFGVGSNTKILLGETGTLFVNSSLPLWTSNSLLMLFLRVPCSPQVGFQGAFWPEASGGRREVPTSLTEILPTSGNDQWIRKPKKGTRIFNKPHPVKYKSLISNQWLTGI